MNCIHKLLVKRTTAGIQIYTLLSSFRVLLMWNVLNYNKTHHLFFFDNSYKADFTAEVTTNVRTELSCKQFHNKMLSRKRNGDKQATKGLDLNKSFD